MLFFDEASLHTRPGASYAWCEKGKGQPRVEQGTGKDRSFRVAGFLSLVGEFLWRTYPSLSAKRVADLYLLAAQAYPRAEEVTVVLDNWPVHFHERALKALEQDPRIRLLRLPTYAPWLNAIEKAWRMLRQNLEHHHPWSGNLQALQERAEEELDRMASQPEELLRYVGLKTQ
ncbi:MAG: transposase [Fimbriimonas sp.]